MAGDAIPDLLRCRTPGASVVNENMSRSLSEKQRKYLRGLAHGREPIVLIGQSGLSDGVTRELDLALATHELVKVRARVGDREERDAIFEQLSTSTASVMVQRIGNVGVFYRPHKDKPKLILPAD